MMNMAQNIDLFSVVVRRKWHLVAVTAVACVLAFVFSGEWFIKPKFKSTAVVYPSNLIPYSNETPSEQLLQLFQSADVRDTMAMYFKLADHYRIGNNGKVSHSHLNAAYEENVSVRKTEFESVRIDILDESPDTACKMVNALIHFVDLKARSLQREKTHEVLIIWTKQLAEKQRQLDSLEHLQQELRVRYGLLDFKSQSKEVSKSLLKLMTDGASSGKRSEVDSLSRNLQEKGGQVTALAENIKSVRDAYNEIKIEYDKTNSDLVKELTYSNVVTRPFVADSKSYPVRWLILLTSAVSAFVLALIVFAVLDGSLLKLKRN